MVREAEPNDARDGSPGGARAAPDRVARGDAGAQIEKGRKQDR
jgi:hypothetical protein